MHELEEKKDQVTYARFVETDASGDADYRRKLNQYVWEILPLTQEQKLEFHS
jgi:hypothetical protein